MGVKHLAKYLKYWLVFKLTKKPVSLSQAKKKDIDKKKSKISKAK